jgi:hypothetical protein
LAGANEPFVSVFRLRLSRTESCAEREAASDDAKAISIHPILPILSGKLGDAFPSALLFSLLS